MRKNNYFYLFICVYYMLKKKKVVYIGKKKTKERWYIQGKKPQFDIYQFLVLLVYSLVLGAKSLFSGWDLRLLVISCKNYVCIVEI